MSEKKIPIAEATEEQLRAFAETHLGISIHANSKIETLRAKVSAAWNKDEITVSDDAPEPRLERRVAPVSASNGKVKLIIQRTDEAGGDEPVPVGVNGRVMLIPRGEEVEVPQSYFEVLKNAIKHIYEPLKDGGINPVPRKVAMYPYQRIA
jgi:hypothetical protein